ncbi:MAG: RNA-dependent DNA polymerase [Gammaproteobacteria bacterium]|nr:RNA-dependent DNA polymerase [Gammaproteobacteria bacterium]
MKRHGYLFESICEPENLYRAYRQARKGKRDRADVVAFELNLEEELSTLRRELLSASYRPGPFRHFTIYERKPRLISVAPFRDRVLHHAIMHPVEPLLDRRFIEDCYACRKGKGVHRAIDRYQHYANRYPYLLKLDIRKYFPSIDHQVLKGILRNRFKDRRLLQLLDRIVDYAPQQQGVSQPLFPGDDLLTPLERRRGLPIGNLTSQVFANLYLDDFDHLIKEQLRVGGYIRYMDDLFLFGDDKARLWAVHEALGHALEPLRLQLHPGKTHLHQSSERMDVLGMIVSRKRRWLRNENGHRFVRRYRKMLRGIEHRKWGHQDIRPNVQSWLGHAQHGETEGLRRRIFNEYPLFEAVRNHHTFPLAGGGERRGLVA